MNAEHTDRSVVDSVVSVPLLVSSSSSLSLSSSSSASVERVTSEFHDSPKHNRQQHLDEPSDDINVKSNAINDMEEDKTTDSGDDKSNECCSDQGTHCSDQIANCELNDDTSMPTRVVNDVVENLESNEVNSTNTNINNNNNNNNHNSNHNNKSNHSNSNNNNNNNDDVETTSGAATVANKILLNVDGDALCGTSETICDVNATSKDIRKLKHVQGRSNSTGKLYNSSRRVSFPENDSELVTGYLEPANPWACVKPATCVSELAEFYRDSCTHHNAEPIESIMKHLDTLDLNSHTRRPILNLREQNLTAESCEALEEVLKRVQYKVIDLTDCGLNDTSAAALFDMIEYYEAANEIDISENRNITNRGWQACINMVKRCHALQILTTRGTPLSEANAVSLGKSMLTASLNTLKLEHCGLAGRPMASLCTYLRKNSVLRELWLAHNDLTCDDALNISNVLKSNFFLQFLDMSNNNIQDRGVSHLSEALIEQANYFKVLHGTSTTATMAPTSTFKHTLTRGEKLELFEKNKPELKYKCLAELINATKPIAVAPFVTTEKLTATDGHGDVIAKPKTESDRSEAAEKKADAVDSNPLVTIFEKTVNNNRSAAVVEGVTVEAPEAAIGDADSMTNTESTEEVGSESPLSNININNNNSCVPVTKDEETTEVVAVADDQLINSSNSDVDVATPAPVTAAAAKMVEKAEEIHETASAVDTTDDCLPLDINENQAGIKLNYAEVVKMDGSLENSAIFDTTTIGASCSSNSSSDSDSNAAKCETNSTTINPTNSSSSSDLEEKVQNTIEHKMDSVCMKRPMEVSSPKPISQSTNNHNIENYDDDDELSPICKIRLPLNSPRYVKTKDIMTELPLTPDSSHSMDSSCEFSTSMAPIGPGRSFSSESLNSETSIESNDSKSSIKLTEAKFSRNGTLERQSGNGATTAPAPISSPNGLQVLMLWNNHLTRNAAQPVSDLLAATTTLEILNVGKNVLSNDFVANIKCKLKANASLVSLGLQSAHLTNEGVKTLSEILDFGGNVTLQRVDLRDNNLQVSGLMALNEVLKSNKSITRIDLDDVPRRAHDHGSDSSIDYSRVVNNIRSLCARNENPPEREQIRTAVKRVRNNFMHSRKISLTCQSIRNPVLDSPSASSPKQQATKAERNLLDPARKSGGRLKSPLPSPIPSPVSSPIPSPSRSRFHVSRVVESNSTVSPITPPSSNSCSPTSFSSTSRFRVTVVEPPKVMSAPVTIINNNSTNKESNESTKLTEMLPPIQPVISLSQSPAKVCERPQVTAPTTQLTVIDSMPGNGSFDSPDLEVKAYMDDSCSSFSSLDSIDRGHDLNTSMSSMESYDILSADRANGESNAESSAVLTTESSSSSLESAGSTKIDNNASSLEVSTCSNDSIYGSQEFPVLKSNEGTLTNSPVSPCSGGTPSDKERLSPKTGADEKRVRKTSWISRGDAVPATLDKLLSIFHHPGHLFFPRSNSGDSGSKKETSPSGTAPLQPQQQPQQQESKPPSRKESPMGGLFAWTKKENVFDECDNRTLTADALATIATANVKPSKSPLQSNVSPEHTINATDSVTIEAIPIKMKQDVKENISPEHTVTVDSMTNLQIKPIQQAPATPPTIERVNIEKVRFEVGGNEDEDDEEDERQALAAAQSQPPMHMQNIAVGKTLSLGQITRDSLSILRGGSNNSQDSMRSLDSLPDIVFEDEQLPQNK